MVHRPGTVALQFDDRQLQVVNTIARLATQDLELRPMLQRIVDALRATFGWEFVAYASVDARNRRFVCEAVSTELPSEVFVGYFRELGSGICGRVAVTGLPIVIDDVASDAEYVETMPGTRSEICVPVRHGSEILGVINAESVRVGTFRGQFPLLQTVADQVAGAIAAARLHEELGRRASLFEMMSALVRTAMEAENLHQVLNRIVRFVRERFALEVCTILLVDESGCRLTLEVHAGESVFLPQCGTEWPIDRGVVGRAFRTGEPQFVADVSRDPDYILGNPAVAAEFVVPIRFREQLLGLLNMESTLEDSFSAENRTMQRALADHVAGAIHLARTNQRLSDTLRLVEEKSTLLGQANERLRVANDKLEHLSTRDALTGIANRRQFDNVLRHEWQRARRRMHPLSLLIADIDRFKAYNDGFGHLAGDECLRNVAQALAGALQRAEDVVARIGGEEFAIVLPETSSKQALRVAEHLREAVAALSLPHPLAAEQPIVTISLGATTMVPHGASEPLQLIAQADKALYAAKLAGRNQVCRFGPTGVA
jgi:diguanylate cyclase (GGDEF)-like protein